MQGPHISPRQLHLPVPNSTVCLRGQGQGDMVSKSLFHSNVLHAASSRTPSHSSQSAETKGCAFPIHLHSKPFQFPSVWDACMLDSC